jgi:hypothetical protein
MTQINGRFGAGRIVGIGLPEHIVYSIKPFFVEIYPERVNGWAAEARISRQGDYAKPIEVPRIRFLLRAVKPTKAMAEHDAIEWARRYIASSAEVLEASLKLEEMRRNPRSGSRS